MYLTLNIPSYFGSAEPNFANNDYLSTRAVCKVKKFLNKILFGKSSFAIWPPFITSVYGKFRKAPRAVVL